MALFKWPYYFDPNKSLKKWIKKLCFHLLNSREIMEQITGIFTYFAQIDEDASGVLDIQEVKSKCFVNNKKY